MTSGFISGICTGKRPPSPNFLNVLQEISNKSQEWWLTGDDLPNLDDVNDLINTYIKLGLIDIDGNMEDSTKETIYDLLNNKIQEKLEKFKADNNFQ